MRPSLTHRFRVATVVPGSEDEVLARWASLERLAGLGGTVVAGCRGGAPRQAHVLTLDFRRSPIEEASL